MHILCVQFNEVDHMHIPSLFPPPKLTMPLSVEKDPDKLVCTKGFAGRF